MLAVVAGAGTLSGRQKLTARDEVNSTTGDGNGGLPAGCSPCAAPESKRRS
jgi:hypothetical protein